MKRKIPDNQKIKTFLSSLQNDSWILSHIPNLSTNLRDRDLSCLKLHERCNFNAFIYVNQITGKYNIWACCPILLTTQHKDCIPVTSHDLVVGDGSEKDVRLYVSKYKNVISKVSDLDTMAIEIQNQI